MSANAPRTLSGQIAWQTCLLPAMWKQIAVSGLSGAFIATQGLDHNAAQAHALTLFPEVDLHDLHNHFAAIEASRLRVEAELRAAQDKENH